MWLKKNSIVVLLRPSSLIWLTTKYRQLRRTSFGRLQHQPHRHQQANTRWTHITAQPNQRLLQPIEAVVDFFIALSWVCKSLRGCSLSPKSARSNLTLFRLKLKVDSQLASSSVELWPHPWEYFMNMQITMSQSHDFRSVIYHYHYSC